MSAPTPDGTSGDLRAQVASLLAANPDRGALLRQMETLAREPAFDACADVWAPGLYDRDPAFFETFLLRHLDASHESVVRELLARAERDRNDTLFAALYRKVADEESWNAELLELARSSSPDEVVADAVRRRDMSQRQYSLSEEAALALYRRDPTRFGDFVQRHVHDDGESADGFAQLLDAVRRQGDESLYWSLFRELADTDQWEKALGDLLRHDVPASAIVAELRKRQPEHARRLDTGLLAEVVDKYGAAALPYVEEHLDWVDRRGGTRLLHAVQRQGDEAAYWRVFFKAGDPKDWNRGLRDLLTQPLSEEGLRIALEMRTPPLTGWGRWPLSDEVAIALYARAPAISRAFLERVIDHPPLALFEAAERAGDDELLDFLTSRLLRQTAWLVPRAYPTPSQLRWLKPNTEAREQLARLSQPLVTHFEQLFARAPADYARHAAAVLSRLDFDENWSFGRNVAHNPAFSYLFRQHREAWRRSPDAIRELLESPNTYIQLMGLTILADGSAGDEDAAQRVTENLPLLRAILLGRASRTMKKLALACLEHAGCQSLAMARQILPELRDILYFRGKRAIDERVMVSFVRLRQHWTTELASQETAAEGSV